MRARRNRLALSRKDRYTLRARLTAIALLSVCAISVALSLQGSGQTRAARAHVTQGAIFSRRGLSRDLDVLVNGTEPVEIPPFCSSEFANVQERIDTVALATSLRNAQLLLEGRRECLIDSTDYSAYATPPSDPCTAVGVLLYTVVLLYMFAGLAIVCDEFFVPALEVMVERFELSNDVAGATLMAAGGSAPELFTSVIGTFMSKSNVGFGTIVGSAVFNVLFVIGMCALFSHEVLSLTWWPLARDSTYYTLSLATLAMLYANGTAPTGEIHTWEAAVLLLLYAGYVTVMKFNKRLQACVQGFVARLRRGKSVYLQQVVPQPGNEAAPAVLDGKGKATDAPAASPRGSQRGSQRDSHRVSAEERLSDATRARVEAGAGGNPFMFHNQFRSGVLNLMFKETNVLDHARVHVVAGIKGDVKETFKRMDLDLSGAVDASELKTVLKDLTGKAPTDEDIARIFTDLKIETPEEGITLAEFSKWYSQSEHRVLGEVHRYFRIMDTSGDGFLDREEVTAVIRAMGTDHGYSPPTEEEIEVAMAQFDADHNGKISEPEFVKWYKESVLWQQVLDEVAETDEDGGPLDLVWPETNRGRAFFLLTAPIVVPLWLTIPDVRRPGRAWLYPITWTLSITWVAMFSYVMVFMAVPLGDALGVSPSVMGTTFLAAGTSIPDLITSVIVARQGFGDMAVSSSIGSNIFDILIGLPLPWLLYNLVNGEPVVVVGDDLLWSVVVLIGMLLAVISTIAINRWRMTKTLGATMFVLYVIFLAQDLYRQSAGC